MMMVAAALVMAGCNNDENGLTDNWNGEIRLSSGITVQQVTRATPTPPDTQIANGQAVGIFISDAITSSEVIATNLKYIADGNGTLTLGTGENTPYYPANGNAVEIYAYQPLSTTIGNDGTYEFSVKTNQTYDKDGVGNGNYYNSDLLYSESSTYVRQKNAHSLSFTHKLSKIVCTLKPGEGNPSLTGATVDILGAETKGTFKPSDGTFTLLTGDQGTKSAVNMNSTITSDSYIAVIPPQTFTKGTNFLKITVGTGVFYYSIPNDAGLTLAASNVYTYEITVNQTDVEVSSTIKEWEGIDANNTTGDAGMSDATN